MKKATLIVLLLAIGFLAGFYHSKEINQNSYDSLQRKYDSVIIREESRLAQSAKERDRLIDSIDNLHLSRQVLRDSIKKLPRIEIFREKLKTLNSSELQQLMLSEYDKFKQ